MYRNDLPIGNIAFWNRRTDTAAVHECDVRAEQCAVCISTKVAKVALLVADDAVACLRIIHHKVDVRLGNYLFKQSFILFLDILHISIGIFILGCILFGGDEACGHRTIRLDDEAAKVTELIAGGRKDDILSVLILHKFLRNRAVRVAVEHHVNAGGVCNYILGTPRAALRIHAKMGNGDDIIRTHRFCRVHSRLHRVIQILAIVAGAEAVDVVPVLILEIRRGGFGDRFRRGDADKRHLLAAEFLNRISVRNGLCRVACNIHEVAGKILEVCILGQFLQPIHAVIEFVVAIHSIVIAGFVHDVNKVPAG